MQWDNRGAAVEHWSSFTANRTILADRPTDRQNHGHTDEHTHTCHAPKQNSTHPIVPMAVIGVGTHPPAVVGVGTHPPAVIGDGN